MGVRWLHQGRSRTGVDCIGLVLLAARNAGLDVMAYIGERDRRDYTRAASPELYALVSKHCTRIDTPIPGCLVFFKFPRDDAPRHFAIYTERGSIIHAHIEQKQVIEHGYRALWPRWTDSLWRLPGVIYG